MNEHEFERTFKAWSHAEASDPASSALRERISAVPLQAPQRRGLLLQSPKWRFQSIFSATKFVVAGAIVALFGGLLLAGVLTQQGDETVPAAVTDSPSSKTTEELLSMFVAEEVEPGVYQVLGDTAGHDLVSEPPRRLVVAPDDSVWVGRGKSDNNGRWINHLVELGQAGRIGLMGEGVWADAQPKRDVAVDTEGRPWIIGDGSNVRVWEDGDWAPARWPNGSGQGDAIATTSDGSVWVAHSVNDNPGPRVARIRDGQWEVLPTLGRAGDYPIGWFGFAPSSDGTVWLSCGSLTPGESPCTAPLQFFDGEDWSTIMPVGQRLRDRPAWLARGPDETIWAYFDGGPFHLGGERSLARQRDGSWTVYDESDGLPQLAYPGGWISSQTVDPQGTLWVTMSWEGPHPDAASASGLADPADGVMSFDGATWRQYLLGISVDQVTATSDGSIWVLGHPRLGPDVRGGLYVITPEAVEATE